MSYLVLARKYRPQTFEQVVDQDHITRTLSNTIAADRVAHAILFCGPRGTGKTTVARILAKAMNCKQGPTAVPCNTCRSCTEITSGHAVDVYEIDGASNNSVDQVRELRENIKYMPADSAYKIYIIDEVHMLSIPAFNALLKTLEEPPSHVMFIFATTEPHKIPITILSRCQRYDFRRIKLDLISTHLGSICEREGFDLTDESLDIIAREAGGSMRDALSLLDQVMSCSKGAISHAQLLGILGVIDRKVLFDFSAAILSNDIAAVLDILDDIYDRGHELKRFYADLLEHFRNLLVVKLAKKTDKLIDLPEHEIQALGKQAKPISGALLNQFFDFLFGQEATIRFASQPKLALEMTFMRLFQIQPPLPIDDLIDKLDGLRQEIAGNIIAGEDRVSGSESPDSAKMSSSPSDQQPIRTAGQEPAGFSARSDDSAEESQDNLENIWDAIYERVSQKNPSLAANLTKCKLTRVTKDRLQIEVVGNGFTVNMIQRQKNIAFLNQICADYFGEEKKILLTTQSDPNEGNQEKKNKSNLLKQKALDHPLVADAIDIFEGKLIDVKIE
jgi:DNA polymerase-3 subunit gamma/tau